MGISRSDFVLYRSIREQLETKAESIADKFISEKMGYSQDAGFKYDGFDLENNEFNLHFVRWDRYDGCDYNASLSWSIDNLLDKSVEEMVAIGKAQLVKEREAKEVENKAQKSREANLEQARRKQEYLRLHQEFGNEA